MTTIKQLGFDEYLALEDTDGLPEGRWQFIDGALAELPPESEFNNFIARYLLFAIASSNLVPLRLIAIHACELEVPVLKPGDARTRYPDLVILREEHIALTARRFTITIDMPPPQLVVEIVSPGDANRQRDYQRKRDQYQQRRIPEFWLVDPAQQTVTVLQLEADCYREIGVFQGDARIRSTVLPALNLTAQQLVSAQS